MAKEWVKADIEELSAIKKARQDAMDALRLYNKLSGTWEIRKKRPRTYFVIVASPNPPEAGIPELPLDAFFAEEEARQIFTVIFTKPTKLA